MPRRLLLTLAVAVAALATVAALASPAKTAVRPPAIKLTDSQFGAILATRTRRALYVWDAEKDFKVECTESCAAVWPPLVVRSAAAVPKKVAGIKGMFGVVRRPEGTLQVTYDGRPVYTYAHEGPNEVRCDNVEGWFVVRV